MRGRATFYRAAFAAVGLALLAGCAVAPPTPPVARPDAVAPDAFRVTPTPAVAPGPASDASRALAEHYARLQQNRLARGLLRSDGGGPDTPVTDTVLIQNFARIALEEEYIRGQGLSRADGASSRIKKWRQPVRMVAEFGPSVAGDQAVADRNSVIGYARRLAQITSHPIRYETEDPNFHVLFVGADDIDLVGPRVQEIVPSANNRALALFDDLPRSIHCLVLAFSREPGGYEYGTAIAVIRAEHPDLMRLSCIHEEIAQGLGLANDSPRARPSIFNDDDEFALLTRMDAALLQLLYNPALTPGMTPDAALPIVASQARDVLAAGS